MDKRNIKNLGLLGAAVLLGIGCVALYKSIQGEEAESTASESIKSKLTKRKYTSRPITIVVSESILSAKLRLGEILSLTEDVVLVLEPSLSKDDLSGIDPRQEYKIIECDTYEGLWSIVKHLNSELVFVVKDDLQQDLPENLERYIGQVVELEQNFSYINQKIFSYIIN